MHLKMSAEQMIALGEEMKKKDPQLAAMFCESMLTKMIESVESAYRNLRRTNKNHPSLNHLKLKLCAYYACKQKDKVKCRKAIDAFVADANELLDNAMEGTLKSNLIIIRGGQDDENSQHLNESYFGEADNVDENSRQIGATLKRSILVLNWFYANLD